MSFINKQISKTLLVKKPINWTSFDVVKNIRSLMKKKYDLKKIKVGHTGTLDPLATGLLIICTGDRTKTINSFINLDKTYIATLKLGAITDSFDSETKEKDIKEYNFITNEQILKSFSNFIGEIYQTPPVFSAIKLNGEPLYKKARRGELNIDIQKRKIIIYCLDLISVNLPLVRFQIKCSKGTYIRSLANDIGRDLGCGAYLHALSRVSVGKYKLEDAVNIENIKNFL